MLCPVGDHRGCGLVENVSKQLRGNWEQDNWTPISRIFSPRLIDYWRYLGRQTSLIEKVTF